MPQQPATSSSSAPPPTSSFEDDLKALRSSFGDDLQKVRATPTEPPKSGWLSDLISESTQGIRNLGSSVGSLVTNTVTHPIDTLMGAPAAAVKFSSDALLAQGNLAMKAEDAFKQGDYVTGTRHAINYLLPFIGPRLDQAGDYMQQGQYAKGIGATLDTATQAFGPKVLADSLPAVEAAMAARRAGGASPGSGALTVDIAKAVPPSASSPYSPMDIQRAMPYLASEHGASPITTVQGLIDASDSAITQIEEHVKSYIDANPTDTIRTKPLAAARAALAQSPRSSAMADGLAALKDLGLDGDLTVKQADAIRLQLNAENKAVLKKNNYDVATARKVDPGFAAREAAVESLRDGIYQQLETRGVPGVQNLRLDEGSLISVRNAAQRQAFSGEKPVSGTGSSTIGAKVTRAVIPAASGAAGAYLGGPIGAASGAVVGNEIARALAPANLSRDALIERAFSKLQPAPVNYPTAPPVSPVKGLLTAHPIELPAAPDTSAMSVTRAARGLVVRDPVTGRFKRVFTSASAPGSGGGSQ